jgi:hypothetical protein
MVVHPIDAPEDWRHAYELSMEDGLDPDLPYHPGNGDSPLDSIEPDIINGLDDT